MGKFVLNNNAIRRKIHCPISSLIKGLCHEVDIFFEGLKIIIILSVYGMR
jgi:hypothetical protein